MKKMSGETMMYALKPVITLPPVLNHSKIMYEMKNIHGEGRCDDHMEPDRKTTANITEQEPLPEFSALETRQERILAELAELKKQVSTLCNFLKQSREAEENEKVKQNEKVKPAVPTKAPVTIDLVVNAHPKRPPYSLLALQKLWTNTDIKIQSYTHSSITGTVPSFCTHSIPSENNNLLSISLIWKEVEDLEFTTSIHGYPLRGEVNFLRYISRLLCIQNHENSNNLLNPNALDQILDWCHAVRHSEASTKTTQEILSLIEDKIKKDNLFDKQEINIAHIAVWSVIKQMSVKKVPTTLNKLFDHCERTFL